MKSIKDYINQDVTGWLKMPRLLNLGQSEDISCSFLRSDGIHLLASLKENYTLIHVSVAAIPSLNVMSKQDLDNYITQIAPEVLKLFFGDRKFTTSPPSVEFSQVNHYFSKLEN